MVKNGPNSLAGVSLDLKRGQFACVVGRVGTFKSSLLSGILGEMHLLEGEIDLRGSVAFVPQKPFIMNATLRENITRLEMEPFLIGDSRFLTLSLNRR